MRKQVVFMAVILFMLSKGTFVSGEDKILKGLPGVCVEVVIDDKELESSGLTEAVLKTDAELKLRMAGIKVLDEVEYYHGIEVAIPKLHISVSVLEIPELKNLLVFNLTVYLYEPVSLSRNSKNYFGAKTWGSGHFGYCGRQKLDAIRDIAKDHVDEFVNDYLSANPQNDTLNRTNGKIY